jgi:hypothetical protein
MKQKFTTSVLIVLLAAVGYFARAQQTATKWQPIVVGKSCTLYSSVLGANKTINIYLPEGYSDTRKQRYPVIYLPDGAMDEDFLHIAGLMQFSAMPWVRRLPPSILVGIVSEDRKKDFTFPTTVASEQQTFPTAGGSEAYINFLVQDLFPFIDQNFYTSKSRTIIGQSLGGLLATEILLTHPSFFSRYIIISPSLWWDDGSLLRRGMGTLSRQTAVPEVYIAAGKEGLVPWAHPHVMEVDANLLYDKLRDSTSGKVNVFFDYLPNEDHATIGHQAVVNAFNHFAAGSGAK